MNLARLRGNRKNGFCHELIIDSTCFALARVLTKTNYIHRSTLHSNNINKGQEISYNVHYI
jgi:hypothetical protein